MCLSRCGHQLLTSGAMWRHSTHTYLLTLSPQSMHWLLFCRLQQLPLASLKEVPTPSLPQQIPSATKTIPQKQTGPEIFTLNELSRSKKRKAADDDEEDVDMLAPPANGSSPADASASPLPDNPGYEAQREAKKQRKAEKKARKKAEKEAKKARKAERAAKRDAKEAKKAAKEAKKAEKDTKQSKKRKADDGEEKVEKKKKKKSKD